MALFVIFCTVSHSIEGYVLYNCVQQEHKAKSRLYSDVTKTVPRESWPTARDKEVTPLPVNRNLEFKFAVFFEDNMFTFFLISLYIDNVWYTIPLEWSWAICNFCRLQTESDNNRRQTFFRPYAACKGPPNENNGCQKLRKNITFLSENLTIFNETFT